MQLYMRWVRLRIMLQSVHATLGQTTQKICRPCNNVDSNGNATGGGGKHATRGLFRSRKRSQCSCYGSGGAGRLRCMLQSVLQSDRRHEQDRSCNDEGSIGNATGGGGGTQCAPPRLGRTACLVGPPLPRSTVVESGTCRTMSEPPGNAPGEARSCSSPPVGSLVTPTYERDIQ